MKSEHAVGFECLSSMFLWYDKPPRKFPMNQYKPRYFDLESRGDVCVAMFRESNLMGTALADSASRDLRTIVSSTSAKTLEIDFNVVKSISSSMISTLMKTREQCLTYGVSLKLVGMSGPMRNIFKTMNLDGTVFEIHESDIS